MLNLWWCMGLPVLQAMVPMWDALNHVTGRANVRLHHCERSGSLQMIATQDIAQVCTKRICACFVSSMQEFAWQRTFPSVPKHCTRVRRSLCCCCC